MSKGSAVIRTCLLKPLGSGFMVDCMWAAPSLSVAIPSNTDRTGSLFGIAVGQTIYYYRAYAEDRRYIKIYVCISDNTMTRIDWGWSYSLGRILYALGNGALLQCRWNSSFLDDNMQNARELREFSRFPRVSLVSWRSAHRRLCVNVDSYLGLYWCVSALFSS